MADHKFTYTVSGFNLTEVQKHNISQAIGAAVATALIGESAKAVKSDFLNICNIHGGKWIFAEAVAEKTVGDVVKQATSF